jgi:nitroreductase
VTAGVFAPSAANYQGVRFAIITNPVTIEFLCKETSPWFKTSLPPCVILTLYDLAKKHTVPLNFKSWHERFIWQDTSCAMMNMMIAAEALGLNSCWASVNPQQEKCITSVLMLRKNLKLTAMLMLGYGNQKINLNTVRHQGALIKKDVPGAVVLYD